MCPACMASAALMLAGVISTGGLAAFAAKLRHSKTNLANTRVLATTHPSSKSNPKNQNERSSNHGDGIKQA
jgi:hypothetical protein